MDYKSKYLKYKTKYLKLRGGSGFYEQPFYYDQSGQAFYYDQFGQPFYYDQSGQPFYYDQYGKPIYYGQYSQPGYSQQNATQCYTLLQEPEEKEKPSEALELVDPNNDGVDKNTTKLIKELENLSKRHTSLEQQLKIVGDGFNKCIEEKSVLEQIIAANNISSTIKTDLDRIIMLPDIRPQFFEKSGPFILNRKVTHIEDEMTEYKDYIIYSNYSNYKRDPKEVDPGGLEYKPYQEDVNPEDLPLSINEVLTKYIVSFLNTSGGRLFFGIDDNLLVVGISNIEDEKHIEHIQIEMTKSIKHNIGAQSIFKKKEFAAIPPDFILFIWHKVFNATNQSHIYVLEIQVKKGSDEYLYMSRNRTFFYRAAAATEIYDIEIAKKIIEQRKTSFKYSTEKRSESVTHDDKNSTEIISKETPLFDQHAAPEEVAPAEEEEDPAEEEEDPAEEEKYPAEEEKYPAEEEKYPAEE